MNDGFDGSFKIYMEPEYDHPEMVEIDIGRTGPGDDPYHHRVLGFEAGQRGPPDDPNSFGTFSAEVDNVKEDLLNLEKLYSRLQESNEEIKIAQNVTTMRELRARLIMDLDQLFKLAKQISKKFDGLVRVNAAQRKIAETESGSSDDQIRASMISQLVDSLQIMMPRFQGLRAQMESDHRQLIEAKYYAITRERATAEVIDNLMASEVPEGRLHDAMQEFGRAPVLDALAEIRERRDTMREVRRNLMALHQVLLGIATPVTAVTAQTEVEGGGYRPGGQPSQVENFPAPPPPAAAAFGGGKVGTAGLNDYEKETRKQAYIAIVIALVMVFSIVGILLKVENDMESQSDM